MRQIVDLERERPYISPAIKIPFKNRTRQIKKIYTVPKPSHGFHKSIYLRGWHSVAPYSLCAVFERMGRGAQTKPLYPLAAEPCRKPPKACQSFHPGRRWNGSRSYGKAEATCDDFTLRRPNWGTVMTLPLNPTSIKPWRWFEQWIILLRRAPCWDF